MKKILVIFALLAVSFASVNAQENLKWGATLGMNSSNFSGDAFSSKIGFHAGVKAEVELPQIAEGVYLDLGALLSLKGAKVNLGSYDIKYNPCYLEIPVHMGYKYAVNENFAVFGNAGPYVAIGLFGKVKTDGIESSDPSDNVFDEDGGGMTSFVVFSSLGFYPVTPGLPVYNIGSPLFTNTKITLDNGSIFEIDAQNASDENKYIQSATLNGQEWNKPWFSHDDLKNGGKLMLIMGNKPNKTWGNGMNAAPPSANYK